MEDEERGFKAILTDGEKGLATSIKYHKIEEYDLKAIDIKAKSEGKLCHYTSLDAQSLTPIKFAKRWVNELGAIVPTEAVKFFLQNADGSETEVQKYTRTKEISVKGYINKSDMPLFVPESYYELWQEEGKKVIGSVFKLWKYMKGLAEEGKVAVAEFSFGNGFKNHQALIYPVVEDTKFSVVMMLTNKNFNYSASMLIPAHEQVSDKVPTLSQITKQNVLMGKLV